jgi:uncharacterized protein involved in cysteine biosynthesis
MGSPPPPRCPRCGHLPDAGDVAGPCRRCRAPAGSPGPAGTPPGFREGLAAPFRGAGYVLRHPVLVPWVLGPLLVVLLAATVLAVVGFVWAGDLAPELADPWSKGLDWSRAVVRWLAAAGLRVAGALAGVYVALALAGTITAPLQDLLSEKTEEVVLGVPDPGRPWSAFLLDAMRGAAAALVVLVLQAAVMAPLFLLSFFALGAPLFAAAGALFAGLGAADVVLGRKRYPGGGRLSWARGRLPFLLGLGAPLSFVPPLLPFAVVGATLAYLDDGRK